MDVAAAALPRASVGELQGRVGDQLQEDAVGDFVAGELGEWPCVPPAGGVAPDVVPPERATQTMTGLSFEGGTQIKFVESVMVLSGCRG
ncbi:hypothetical protein GCM10009850_096120 [Nonomuraea monospora]|uniref:Uncharacterized protein n=1 Tax=Nonomuraea monospora TaxID=568818 RepID=A0ABN3CY30_9ACTN